MPRVARIRTLIAKACGVLFSVAGGTYCSDVLKMFFC